MRSSTELEMELKRGSSVRGGVVRTKWRKR
jgi:hypothetical protein